MELGYGMIGRNPILEEQNPELRWPQCNRVFTEMWRTDAVVQSVYQAMTLPIMRAGWWVVPNGAPPEVVARVAGDLRLRVQGDDPQNPIPRRRGRVSWAKHLEELLFALVYGHAFFEQVYEADEHGEEHLVKLARRLPGTIRKINVARDGGLESIEQVNRGGLKSTVIPVDRLVAYCYQPLDTSWLGTSFLRPVYKNYKLANELMKIEVIALDRNGMGVPTYEPSREQPPEDVQEDMRRGQELVSNIRHGSTVGVVTSPGGRFTLQGTQGQLASSRPAIEAHQAMVAKSVLAHFLNLDGKGGSYALAETQADLFIQSLQTKAEWICDVANQHIVEDLVEVAFPDYDGPCPLISCDPIAARKELTAEALAVLVNAGVILPDRDLEEDTRSRYSLPPKRPLERAREVVKNSEMRFGRAVRALRETPELVRAVLEVMR